MIPETPDFDTRSHTKAMRLKVILVIGFAALAIAAPVAILLLDPGPLRDPAAAADAMSSIGFQCQVLPEQDFVGSAFGNGVSCSDKPVAVVFVFFLNPSANPGEFHQSVSRIDELCSDEDRDDGYFLYGLEEPVWVEVTSPYSGPTETYAVPAHVAERVAATLGVTLRHC